MSNSCSKGLLVLGGGANLLVGDDTLDATVITLQSEEIVFDQQCVIVDAGCSIIKLVQQTYRNSLSGLEWATAIPGTWGGALKMNAGAYGSETGEVVEWAEVLTQDFNIERIYGKDIAWSYRKSTWPVKIICFLKACLKLAHGDMKSIKERQINISRERNKKFPKAPCAGSVFKNPKDVPAGKLIEECGLRGHREGGAIISKEHANIFINKQGNSADMIKLMILAKNRVKTQIGVDLEPEIVLWDNKNWDFWQDYYANIK